MFQERFSLETPEHVPVEFEVAGPMARFAAALFDGLLLGIGLTIGAVLLAVAAALSPGAFTTDVLVAIGAVALGAVLLGYFPLFEYFRKGQTPGKRALGIRVMRRDMAPLDFGSVFLRGVLRMVDAIPAVPFPLVGLVTMTVSRRGLRLGDLAAGTWVVRDPDLAPLADGPLFSIGSTPAPVGRRIRPAPGAPAPAGEGLLTAEEFRLASDFLARAPGLAPASRRAAAVYIAGPVLRRLGVQRIDAENFLREEVAKGPAGKSLL